MLTLKVPDMSCGHCVAAINEALKAADAQARVEINREARTATVDSALPRETLAAALTAGCATTQGRVVLLPDTQGKDTAAWSAVRAVTDPDVRGGE